MKLLWLSNITPGPVQQNMFGRSDGGLWVDQVLEGLRKNENLQIHVFCPNDVVRSGALDERCSFETFRTGRPEISASNWDHTALLEAPPARIMPSSEGFARKDSIIHKVWNTTPSITAFAKW